MAVQEQLPTAQGLAAFVVSSNSMGRTIDVAGIVQLRPRFCIVFLRY